MSARQILDSKSIRILYFLFDLASPLICSVFYIYSKSLTQTRPNIQLSSPTASNNKPRVDGFGVCPSSGSRGWTSAQLPEELIGTKFRNNSHSGVGSLLSICATATTFSAVIINCKICWRLFAAGVSAPGRRECWEEGRQQPHCLLMLMKWYILLYQPQYPARPGLLRLWGCRLRLRILAASAVVISGH